MPLSGGVLDGSVGVPPHPPRNSLKPRRGRTRILRICVWVAGSAFVLFFLAMAVDWFINYPPIGSGDPGGVISGELAALHVALPTDATNTYNQVGEPQWIGLCNDQHSAMGWSQVTYSIDFQSADPTQVVASHVEAEMSRLGWRRGTTASDGALTWMRHLQTGQSATAELTPPTAPTSGWSLYATANPNAPVGGCSGG